MLQVLHAVNTFLNVTENWIYPQIVCVPNVESRVICGSVINLKTFPVPKRSLIVYPPPWNFAFGVSSLLNALARRLGCGGAVAGLKIRWWRPLIVHAHFGKQGWASLALRKRLNIPLITSFYGYDAWRLPKADPVWQQRYHELFLKGDIFLVEGPAMRDRLVALGCPVSKVRIHRIGVDLTKLQFEAKSFSHGLAIAMVGRFVEKKGLADGLRACAQARSRGVKLNVTIIGDASAKGAVGQRIKAELQTLAGQPELSGRVHFAGFVPLEKTRDVLKTHNVFLCPSKHAANGDAEGGSPVTLTEAMAFGLLCIGTRHCDIPEVILDSKTGFLCNEGDVAGIADVLCTVAHDQNGLAQVAEAGRRHVEEYFSLQVQLNRLRTIYASVSSNDTTLKSPLTPSVI